MPGEGEPFDWVFENDDLVIGRASTADVTVADRFLSRRHTRLFRRGDQVLVQDLGSRNGTLLNGTPVSQPTAVTAGDILQVSNTRIILEQDEWMTGGKSEASLSSTRMLKDLDALLADSMPVDDDGSFTADSLQRYADRLKLISEVHEALASSVTLETLFDLILDRAVSHLQPEQALILLRGDDGAYHPAAHHGQSSDGILARSRSLAREVGEQRVAALVLDVEHDERFSAAASLVAAGVHSLLAAPLVAGDRDETLGIIVLASPVGTKLYTEEDLELLVTLASVAAMRLRNLALQEEALERRRMQQEVELARRIQEGLLPTTLPVVPGFSLLARNLPSRGVSGDWYTVLERTVESGRREWVVMVADVSGKGVGASLLTASLEALTADPVESGQPPEEIFARLARRLYDRTPPEKFATAFMAVVDAGAGRVQYANAGHNPGLLVRADGTTEELGTTGLPLGVLPMATYQSQEVELAAGDLLVLYTDGITEAENPDDEEFGFERLTAVCVQHRASTLEEVLEALGNELSAFADGIPFADDRTLVLIKREAG